MTMMDLSMSRVRTGSRIYGGRSARFMEGLVARHHDDEIQNVNGGGGVQAVGVKEIRLNNLIVLQKGTYDLEIDEHNYTIELPRDTRLQPLNFGFLRQFSGDRLVDEILERFGNQRAASLSTMVADVKLEEIEALLGVINPALVESQDVRLRPIAEPVAAVLVAAPKYKNEVPSFGVGIQTGTECDTDGVRLKLIDRKLDVGGDIDPRKFYTYFMTTTGGVVKNGLLPSSGMNYFVFEIVELPMVLFSEGFNRFLDTLSADKRRQIETGEMSQIEFYELVSKHPDRNILLNEYYMCQLRVEGETFTRRMHKIIVDFLMDKSRSVEQRIAILKEMLPFKEGDTEVLDIFELNLNHPEFSDDDKRAFLERRVSNSILYRFILYRY